jgi:hypothetical protein
MDYVKSANCVCRFIDVDHVFSEFLKSLRMDHGIFRNSEMFGIGIFQKAPLFEKSKRKRSGRMKKYCRLPGCSAGLETRSVKWSKQRRRPC